MALYVNPMEDASLHAFLGALPRDVAGMSGGPTAVTAAAMAGIALACWIGQVSTGFWSWVDRVWSIAPAAYVAVYACYSPSPRLLLMAGLTAMWGLRLTLNFARKGGYGSEEDYRWPILRDFFAKRDPVHPLGRELFSLLFVAVYQNLLLWLFTAPQAYLASAGDASGQLTPIDYLCATGFFLAFMMEAVTDEQQWAFQTKKHAMTPAQRAAAGGDYARGFCTSGVFALSRHLNFFAEQSMWWCIYGFTVAAGAPIINWSIIGPLLLSGLFQGSTWMTELLSVSKYPAYAAYQRTTSKLVPWLPGVSLDSPEGAKLLAEVMPSKKQ